MASWKKEAPKETKNSPYKCKMKVEEFVMIDNKKIDNLTSKADLSERGKWISRACIEIFSQEGFTPCIYVAVILIWSM